MVFIAILAPFNLRAMSGRHLCRKLVVVLARKVAVVDLLALALGVWRWCLSFVLIIAAFSDIAAFTIRVPIWAEAFILVAVAHCKVLANTIRVPSLVSSYILARVADCERLADAVRVCRRASNLILIIRAFANWQATVLVLPEARRAEITKDNSD